MKFLKKIANPFLYLFWNEDYLGGTYDIKEYNFFGVKFKRKCLPKICKCCEEYYGLPKVTLSITAILKNEAPYIREWIEYHIMKGVERFYLYDNESNDNIKEILKPYIDNGIVFYHYIIGEARQLPAYRDAIYKYKNQTKWMAFIDIDEFILPVEKESIQDFLKDYENFSGIGVNWIVYDSNGYVEKPTEHHGLVTANYYRVNENKNVPVNHHIKTIANPRKILSVANPHFMYYVGRELTVDENKKIIKGPFTEKNNSEKIRINHYACKSRDEYIKRLAKEIGRAHV